MGSGVSHETLYSHNDDQGYRYYAVFEENYFEQGACRYAFKGTLHGSGPRKGNKCVVKVFKKEYAKNIIQWSPDLAASKKASEYALLFKERCIPGLNRLSLFGLSIEFLIPLLAKMQEIKHFNLLWFIPIFEDLRYVQHNEYVALEPFIYGNYLKFNSNSGYEDTDGMKELLATFCHWTWHISGHKYMICDLQGIQSNGRFILTDPAIHSYDERFGPTDLGCQGMEMVLSNHTCGQYCKYLELENPLKGIYINRPKKSTTFSFQVTEELHLRRKKQSDYFPIMEAIAE